MSNNVPEVQQPNPKNEVAALRTSPLLQWWKEPAFWVIAPFIGYFLAYRYQAGYCGAFQVPEMFIQVELASVLQFTGQVIVFGFFFLTVVQLALIGSDIRSTAYKPFNLFARYAPLIAVWLALWLFSTGKTLIFFTSLIVGLFLCDLASAALSRRKGQAFSEALISSDRPFMDQSSPLNFLYRRGGAAAVMLFLILWLGSIVATRMGVYSATHTPVFLVPSSQTNSVVVLRYGDRLVCAFFDGHTKKLKGEFLVLSTSGEKEIRLESKALGPLVFE